MRGTNPGRWVAVSRTGFGNYEVLGHAWVKTKQTRKEKAMNQEELMGKTKDAVRHEGFTVSDNYLKGCDYPFGGGWMISCEGMQFGSLRYQGGGVSFGSEPIAYYITSADDIPLFVNRVEMAWADLEEEGES
jgi:hypothetical protein